MEVKKVKVKRIFNNNVLLAEDDQKNEKMLVGKGIGFNRKTNDRINQKIADKVYILESDYDMKEIEELIKSVPSQYLILTKEIIEQAENFLNAKFKEPIYIGLTDHIHYALTRAGSGESLSNAMLWEIKKFYPQEYQASLKALKLIQEHTGILLSEDEAGFIAFHFVNGKQNGGVISDSQATARIIQDILSIIKFHYKIDFNENSLNYTRFITHLRFFLQRSSLDAHPDSQEDFLFNQVKKKYPDTYSCVLRIKQYLKDKIRIEMNNDELFYFMLHLQRLTAREQSK